MELGNSRGTLAYMSVETRRADQIKIEVNTERVSKVGTKTQIRVKTDQSMSQHLSQDFLESIETVCH